MTNDFVSRVSEALFGAERGGVRVTASAGSCNLEAQHFAHLGEESEAPSEDAPGHLEGAPGVVDPGEPNGKSRLCYFLDGVQSTREIGRIGAVPVVVTTVAAAIVNRCDRRFSRMVMQGPPAVVRAVILPRGIDDGANALFELLRAEGLEEIYEELPITSSDLVLSSTEYTDFSDPSNYVGMRALAFGRARSLRERIESELLQWWQDDEQVSDDDWIAVDGQLRTRVEDPPRRAIGLIKSVAQPEFTGEDAKMLLDLAPGTRTTSFVPGWQRGRKTSEHRTSWYLRAWPPQRGADALGSLMRIEAHRDIRPETVDEITRWVLAEKAPLAKPDPRWPAMIYPIQYVEKVLKPTVQGSERAFGQLERQLLAANGGN